MTLVELLLAVGMFSFLMASVGQLVLMSLRVQQSWGGAVASAQRAEHALNRLAQDLHAARPLFGVPFQVVSGGDGVEFARLGPEGWLRVVYRLEPDGEMRRLIRDEWTWTTGQVSPDPLQHELLARLAAGRFAAGMLTEDGQLVWTSSWDGEADGIPRLVQLEAVLPSTASGKAITVSRVIRNPAGTLPEDEQP